MPTNRKFDILLNRKGYMLSREVTKTGGRAWQRTGTPDTPDKRPREAETVGVLAPQIEYPEVWNDWSGGFGYPYRHPRDQQSFYSFYENPNRIHWSEGFDTRWPHQLVHVQQMQTLPARYATINSNVVNLIDLPPAVPGQAGEGVIALLGAGPAGSLSGFYTRLVPTGLAAAGSAFDVAVVVNDTSGAGRPAIFGSFVYWAPDNADPYFSYAALDNTGAPYNRANGSNPIRGFTTAGNRLWGYGSAPGGRRIFIQSVAANASPGQYSDWSATLTVGNQQHQINDLRSYKDQLFAGLDDGLYAGDSSGTFVNVMNDLIGHADQDNCRDIAIFNGAVIVQHVAGLYSYNPALTNTGQVKEIGPNLLSNRSPIVGKIRTLEAFGPWLYAGLWTGSQSYLLAGIDDTPGGAYTWHVLNRFPNVARPQRMHVDGVTTSSGGVRNLPQRMWVATDPSVISGGTAPLYFWPVPLLNGDPLGAQMYFSPNYHGSARIDLGIVDSRAPATAKLYRSVTIESENLVSLSRYADVYYTIDQGTRVLLGRAIDSPTSTLYFPSAEGSFATGYSIELSMESFTTTPAISPVYRTIIMRSTFRPDSVDLITAVIDLDDSAQDRQGSAMRPAATQLLELRAMARQNPPVHLIDLIGIDNIVAVLDPIEEGEVYQASDENPKVAATVKMAVMRFSGSAA